MLQEQHRNTCRQVVIQFAKSQDKKIGLFVQRSNFLGFPDLDFTFWKSMTFQDVNDPMNHDGATLEP